MNHGIILLDWLGFGLIAAAAACLWSGLRAPREERPSSESGIRPEYEDRPPYS